MDICGKKETKFFKDIGVHMMSIWSHNFIFLSRMQSFISLTNAPIQVIPHGLPINASDASSHCILLQFLQLLKQARMFILIAVSQDTL